MSIRFSGKRFTFRQPDGTTLEVVGTGNQHAATFATLDGHTVVQDPATGYYEYAVLTPEGDDLQPSGVAPGDVPASTLGIAPGLAQSAEAARASARRPRGLPKGGTRWEERLAARRRPPSPALGLPAPPSRTTTGSYVGLVLLIEFPDVPATIPQPEVTSFCNKKNYDGFGNKGSVKDYFAAVSDGKLQYENIVAPYYTAKKNRSYYTNPNVDQPIRTVELIREALGHWKQAGGVDFSALTLDDENCAYALNVFYVGDVKNNWGEGLWPHSHHLTTRYKLAPSRFAHDYQITNMGSELTLGTFCHENGHMICDFPDLYDTGYQSSGVGTFCLMCAGNFDEKNPSQVGAYLKYRAGWGKPALAAPGNASLHAGKNDFLIHRKSPTEYFILENRARSGRDASLKSEGLAIWHIDENGDNDLEDRTPTKHYECSLIQADGRFDLEKNKDHYGDAGDLFGKSVKSFGNVVAPRAHWWDGSASGFEIDEISDPGPVVTFVVKQAT